jgi:hypothetical protein
MPSNNCRLAGIGEPGFLGWTARASDRHVEAPRAAFAVAFGYSLVYHPRTKGNNE